MANWLFKTPTVEEAELGDHKIRHAKFRQAYQKHVLSQDQLISEHAQRERHHAISEHAQKENQQPLAQRARNEIQQLITDHSQEDKEDLVSGTPKTGVVKQPPKFYFHTVQMDNKTVVAVNIK